MATIILKNSICGAWLGQAWVYCCGGFFNSPEVAVIAAITIDLVGTIPTFKHSWLKPHEETWITYALSALGAAITLAISGEWAITAVAYPLYLVVASGALALCILASPHRKLAGEPAELREL